MKKQIVLFGIFCCLSLAACTNANEGIEAGFKARSEKSANADLLNRPFEELTVQDWQSIHLTKEDFDLYLMQLPAKDADGVQEIAEAKMDSGKISIIMNNRGKSSLDNLMSAPFIDTEVRTVFMHSEYYQGQQPVIVISDSSGTVLSDTAEPLETVIP